MTQITRKSEFPQGLPASGVDASEWVLDTMFGARKLDAWIAIVQDPSSRAQWFGGRYNVLSTALRTATGSGHYFSCVLVKPGETRRLNRTAESGVCVFFDDVGYADNPNANIDKVWLDVFGLDPTFAVETSLGNFQYTYVFETPVTPVEQLLLAKAFKANLRTRGGFKDGNDLVRYGRLPSGVNPKSGRGGFDTRLVAGSGRTYSLDEIVKGFGLRLGSPQEAHKLLDADGDGGSRTLDVDDDALRVDLVREACEAILNDLDRTDWIHMAHAIDGALGGDPAGRDIFVDFTSRRTSGDIDDVKAALAWDTMGEGHSGYGFLMQRLRAQGTAAATDVLDRITQAQARTAFVDDPLPPPAPEAPLAKLVPHPFVAGKAIPPREWLAPGWIPMNKVTLLQGDGGDGKTLLMHQLQASCATASPWIGLQVEPCPSGGIYTEDDAYDTDERQAAIDLAYGVECCTALHGLYRFPRADDDNELVAFDRMRRPILTKFYAQLVEMALDLKLRLLTLDVAVDLFGGNEIVRPEVRALFRPLGRLARRMGGAVVMSTHVSQSGIRTDGGHSGSTDWSNAARSRLYLNRPKTDDGALTDPDARTLTRKKTNYAALGDTVDLKWERGVLVPVGGAGLSAAGRAFKRSCEDVFMDILGAMTRENQVVSHKSKSGLYAPNVIMRRPPAEREGWGKADFERAVQGLIKAGRIKVEPYGPPSDRTEKLVKTGP